MTLYAERLAVQLAGEIVETGGGGRAIEVKIEDHGFAWITAPDGMALPTVEDDLLIGFYEADGEWKDGLGYMVHFRRPWDIETSAGAIRTAISSAVWEW